MEAMKRLDDDHQVIDEFVVATLLDIEVGSVRGLRRRGLGPDWFRVDGKSPRYTLGSVKNYIEKIRPLPAKPSRAI
jgi:hypothetical protein